MIKWGRIWNSVVLDMKKKHESDAKTVLNQLGKLSTFLADLEPNADKDACFDVPLEIIRDTLLFDVSVLYKVSNVIDDRLILEVVKKLDPKDVRPDLQEGAKLTLFLDNRDERYLNEVTAFLNQRISGINVPGTGCDIMGYVFLPESFGGAYLFGGDFYGKESAIKDYELSCVQVMCNFISSILLKTQFEHQAIYDHLTGLYNSQKIRQMVGDQLKRFERKPQSPSCIALCDIDHFKKVNDTFGHIQGDMVLKQVGKILSEGMRSLFDAAGRYGGEEFCLILEQTDPETAFRIVERLRKQIESTCFEKTDKSGTVQENEFLNITMSFGIAGIDKGTGVKDATAWISQADKALYLSKANGRNRTTIFSEDE